MEDPYKVGPTSYGAPYKWPSECVALAFFYPLKNYQATSWRETSILHGRVRSHCDHCTFECTLQGCRNEICTFQQEKWSTSCAASSHMPTSIWMFGTSHEHHQIHGVLNLRTNKGGKLLHSVIVRVEHIHLRRKRCIQPACPICILCISNVFKQMASAIWTQVGWAQV